MAYFYTYNAIRLNANQHIAALQGSFTPFVAPPPTGDGSLVYPLQPIPSSNVYYVAPNGSTGNNGSYNSPWTLQHAANNTQPGWTIVAKDGVYTTGSGEWVVQITRSGTSASPVRFVSENRWGAILDGQQARGQGVAFWDNVQHVIWEGFQIRNTRGSGAHGNRTNGSSNITIRGNMIYDISRYTTPCSDQIGRTAVYTGRGERRWTIDGNIIFRIGRLPGGCLDSPRRNDYQYDHGIYIMGDLHVVVNNIFFDNTSGWDLKIDLSTGNTSGYARPTGTRSAIIMNNTFASTKVNEYIYQKGSIRFWKNDWQDQLPINVLLMNNVFYRPEGNPIYVGGGGGWPWPGTEVVDNVTTTSGMIYYDPAGGSDSQFTTLTGSILNVSGTMGMTAPKNSGAVETDFTLTNNATSLIGTGRAAYSRSGLATVSAPARDRWNRVRPSSPSRGAFDYYG